MPNVGFDECYECSPTSGCCGEGCCGGAGNKTFDTAPLCEEELTHVQWHHTGRAPIGHHQYDIYQGIGRYEFKCADVVVNVYYKPVVYWSEVDEHGNSTPPTDKP